MRRRLEWLLWLSCLAGIFHATPLLAQSPKLEFRGAWIATVINLDWPTSSRSSTAQKQNQLREMLDELAATGINSVFFQVRTECDALYDSPFEPWSVYLTGQQGSAPAPYFDPLAFAVEFAHSRGLSLHAWLNPFRCEREVGRYALAPDHPLI
ncbi:MAG: family 10 glycosylhydrolase, partial [Rhodothermales bacterium]|nr:family 10 glycosylhydrolase [Rhodothermales bacterium]